MLSGGVLARGGGLVILGWLALEIVSRGLTFPTGGVLWFVHGVDLIFHEAGHVFLGFFGQFVHMLGGSLVQVLVPAGCAAYFFLHRQPSACAVALFWTGESLTDLAIYVADGQRQALPLLARGMTHDWHYLLGRLGLLSHAELLGGLVLGAGVPTILGALILLAVDLFRAWDGAKSVRARGML